MSPIHAAAASGSVPAGVAEGGATGATVAEGGTRGPDAAAPAELEGAGTDAAAAEAGEAVGADEAEDGEAWLALGRLGGDDGVLAVLGEGDAAGADAEVAGAALAVSSCVRK
jgi:hypothetical protein